MGQLIQGLRQQISSGKGHPDFVDICETMLVQRHQNFLSEINNSIYSQKQIPIANVLQKKYETRFNILISPNNQIVATEIAQQFSQRSLAAAIGLKIWSTMEKLLAKNSDSIQEERGYLLFVGTTGVIMRIDYLVITKVFKQNFKPVVSNFCMCSYVISDVDEKELSFNIFASLLETLYDDFPREYSSPILKRSLEFYKSYKGLIQNKKK